MPASNVANLHFQPITSRPRRGADNVVFSAFLCLLTVAGFALVNEDCQHWLILPVYLCGVLVGIDAIEWLRGQMDVMDPKGVLGVFGVHFFFVAPLLHVSLNFWMWEVAPAPDWRPWVGYMATLNFLGLLVYRFVVARLARNRGTAVRRTRTWTPQTRTLLTLLSAAIVVGTIMQLLVYRSFGGISGYIAAVQDRRFSFLGDTWVMMIAGRVPYLSIIAIAVYWRKIKHIPSWPILGATLSAFVVIQLLFGGLRGERSDIIYALFLAIGVVHYWIRPLSKKIVFAGIGFLVAFMYVYGFYKFGGTEGLQTFANDSQQRAAMEDDFHHSFAASLLGDLGRTDMQAYLLYRLSRPENDMPYSMGRTYFGAAITLIPGPLWRNRPPSKIKETWDILYGARTFEREFGGTAFSDRPITTRIMGLAGETMANFGPYAVPLAFSILGACVGFTRRRIEEWRLSGDSRLLLVPLLTTICLTVLTGDSDNVLFVAQMSGLVPFVILFLGSKRRTFKSSYVLRTIALCPTSAS